MGRRGRGKLSVCGSRWGGGRAVEDCGRGEVQGGWRVQALDGCRLTVEERLGAGMRGGLANGGEISLL